MSFLYDNLYIFGVIAGSFLFMGINSVYNVRTNVKRLKLAEDGFERRLKRSFACSVHSRSTCCLLITHVGTGGC